MDKTSEQQRRGEGIRFERIRRITGYLVGTTDRWNNAKKAELADRIKHGLNMVDRPTGSISTRH
jgi:hypothetical protein